MRLALVVGLLALPAAARGGDEFWAHWGDGKAEMNGYKLTQPRYGQKRSGSAVLIFVTEDMSDSLRVKADPGKHPKADVHPVMKLNAVRHFQTGIYDYKVMTSVFARVAAGWPLAKISFSSQEWCGHVYHQLLPRGSRIEGVFHSYFDGEADGTEDLPLRDAGWFEDLLPITFRSWLGAALEPGGSRTVPLLPSLLRVRLEHKPLAWTRATITRSATAAALRVKAGAFQADTWTVAIVDGPKTAYWIESTAPFRILGWRSDTGEEAELLGSTRLAYWKLNGPGGESSLKDLGLSAPLP